MTLRALAAARATALRGDPFLAALDDVQVLTARLLADAATTPAQITVTGLTDLLATLRVAHEHTRGRLQRVVDAHQIAVEEAGS